MKQLLGITLLSMASCNTLREAPSQIVQKATACGAGDLSSASILAVEDWFNKHRACAAEVDAMCKPVREKAMAEWGDSTEGRVCLAARNVSQWSRRPSKDHETFQSGWK